MLARMTLRPRTLSLMAVLFLLALGTMIGALSPDRPEDKLHQLRRDLIARRHDAAIEGARDLLSAAAPGLVQDEARVLLGAALLRKKDHTGARESLVASLGQMTQDSPWRARARFLLADAAESLGDGPTSAQIFEEESELAKSDERRRDLAGRFRDLAEAAMAPVVDPARPLDGVPEPDWALAVVYLDEAIASLSDATTFHEQIVELTRLAARAELKRGQAQAAVHRLDPLVSRHAEDGRFPNAVLHRQLARDRGEARIEAGDLDGGRRDLMGLMGASSPEEASR
ncbi:MAG: hypothetical protein KDB53_10270, partial [Planctomycetes bacterium]|nr:hypothetical protein [Planctomycetota bacterium]